jgi:hypothetical protein
MATHLMYFCDFYSILFDSDRTSCSYRIQDSNLTHSTNDKRRKEIIKRREEKKSREEKRREEKKSREEKRREEKRREEKRREEKRREGKRNKEKRNKEKRREECTYQENATERVEEGSG